MNAGLGLAITMVLLVVGIKIASASPASAEKH